MEKAELQTTEALDYTVGIYDDTALIASGSLSGKTIKCVAVCKKYQSENLLTQLVVHLLEKLREENQLHSFLYTKPKNEQIFQSLGFQKVVANQEVLFMEQGKPDFADYLGCHEFKSFYERPSVLSRKSSQRKSTRLCVCFI